MKIINTIYYVYNQYYKMYGGLGVRFCTVFVFVFTSKFTILIVDNIVFYTNDHGYQR